jgi:hypothetical protein
MILERSAVVMSGRTDGENAIVLFTDRPITARDCSTNLS